MAPDGSSPATTARCRCGRAIESDHRYCPACGDPTTGLGPAGLDPADDSLMLLGRSGAPARDESVVRTGPGLVPRLVGIGLAVVGLGLMWSLFRQPTSEVAPEPAQEEAVDTEQDPTEDAADDGAPAEDEEAVDDEPEVEDEADAPSTTRSSASGPTSSDPADDRPLEPPLLGEETGLILAVGREGSSTLQILDLDSGVLQELDRVSGRPIGAIDSWLVLQSNNTGRTSRLDLDDLEAEPVDLDGGPANHLEVVEITEDRIWAIGEREDGPVLLGYGIDGEVLEELDFPIYGRFGYGPWSLVRPSSVLYDPAGGLYRRVGDGFELVAEGQVLAAGERLAVIRQCDENLQCLLRWYDIRTSAVIGFPAPPPSSDEGFYQLLGGDRWLAYYDFRTGQGQLIEVATATIGRDLDMDAFFRFGPTATAITDDGRWLAETLDGKLVVVDLEDGTEWQTGIRGGSTQTVFVKRSRS